MKIYELLNENFPFHSDTTEMPFYDDMMKNPEYFEQQKGLQFELKKMSPDQYIDKVSKSKNIPPAELLRNRDPNTIADYRQKMVTGEKFPILTLDYSRGEQVSQEGLHRAFAAKDAGVDKVPVMIVNYTDEEKEYIKNK